MVVAMGAMDVTMCNFFLRSSPHFQDFQAKTQNSACQRMVAIQIHGIAFDLEHRKYDAVAAVIPTLKLPADLHTGWKLLFGYGLEQGIVAKTKGIFRLQLNRGLETGFLAF